MLAATIDGPLNADLLKVGGNLLASSVGQYKNTFRSVSLINAEIGGNVSLTGASVDGALNGSLLQVGGNLLMNSDKDNKAGFKQVDLTGAKVTGQLSFAGARVDGALQASLLQVSGSLFMNSAGLKDVDLIDAKVAGQLSLNGASLSGALSDSELPRHLRVGQIHVLEAGLVLGIGIHEQRAADLQLARIQLVLERGAGEFDVSIDLGAGKKHLAFEHGAIAQPQIALGTQTGGIEDAVHQRAFQPDQTVRARADQVDPAFDPAVEDRERSNELRAFEIEVPDDAGTFDLNSRGGDRLPPRRSREQILQKACGESAAVVAPARILLVIGVERRRVAALVEIGHFTPLDLGQRPAFGGVWVAVGLLRQGRAESQPNRQHAGNRRRIWMN